MVTLLFFQLIFCRIELQVERAFFLLARLLPQVLNSYTSLDRDDGDGRKKNCNGTNAQPRSSTASELELENLKMQSISVEFQKRKQPRKQKMTLALIKTLKTRPHGHKNSAALGFLIFCSRAMIFYTKNEFTTN